MQGRKFLKEHEKDILNIEKNTGVDRYIMVAIWGRETAYGTHKLPHDAIRVLATQAFTGRRKDVFRLEIIAALKMLQAGVPRAKMRASWAGAVGLTQFMPTEYFKHLDDGDGDGKVDIFDSVPDALALGRATARQQGLGARPALGLRGAHAGGRRLLARGTARRAHHRRMGRSSASSAPATSRSARAEARHQRLSHDAVRRLRARLPGDPRTSRSSASTTRPTSTPLFVGNLADRIAGVGGFHVPAAQVAQPRTAQVKEIQERLQKLGYPMDKIDGKIGSNTRRQVGTYQKSVGLKIDCWPTEATLSHLRSNAARAPQ